MVESIDRSSINSQLHFNELSSGSFASGNVPMLDQVLAGNVDIARQTFFFTFSLLLTATPVTLRLILISSLEA